MERPHVATQYFLPILLPFAEIPEPRAGQAGNGKLTAGYQADKLEFIKNPMITEFLGLSGSTDFTESKLESCIITNIQKFLMELGQRLMPL